MWILKNSKDQGPSPPAIALKRTFDLSTLYTTTPYSKLMEMVTLFFIKKNGQRGYKYLVLGRDKSYFVKKKPLWFCQKVFWNWYHQNARVFDWQHICYVWLTCFSTDSLHIYGYKLWSSSRGIMSLFVQGRRLNTGASQEKRKEHNLIL